MSNFSVPDLLSYARLSRNVSSLKSRADTTRTESTTGRYDDITKHLNGDVGSAHILMKAIDDAKTSQQNLTTAETRAQVTQSTLDNLNTESTRIATDFLASLKRGDYQSADVSAEDAKAAIVSAFGSLNTSVGGRALFGGDDAGRPPLASPDQLIADVKAIMAGATDAADAEAQLDFYFNDPAGGFATTIYQGGAGRASSVEIAPDIRVDVSAKADDQAIKDTLRGLATIVAYGDAGFADADTEAKNGAGKVFEAETELTNQRAVIGINEARVSAAKARSAAEETVLTNLYNSKTARDPYEAASELQLLESQLEASYLLTARMAKLSIADYLR